ncbi:MAG: hypothetical protein Q9159_003013 [Coniocarpon cinnabarinum]
MSNSNTYYSSTSFSSSSYSSTSNGQTTGYRQASHTQTDPSGTRVQSASQNAGQPVITESRQYDAQGRPMVEGTSMGQGRIGGGGAARPIEGGRVQEIDDEAAKKYEERIEDEYAKREGGA